MSPVGVPGEWTFVEEFSDEFNTGKVDAGKWNKHLKPWGERAWTPFVTFWQSEFVRMRLQYQDVSRDFASPRGDTSDKRVWWQVTFAAGPHKHASY